MSATADGRTAARTALKVRIAARVRQGNADDLLTADSLFSALADAWLEDLCLDVDRSEGTKEVYERELRTLVMPTFQHFVIRELTVGKVERFLRAQREKSYARAKHSRTLLVSCKVASRNHLNHCFDHTVNARFAACRAP